MVSDERMEEAIKYLGNTDETFALAKGEMLRTEFQAKVAEAVSFKAHTGSVEERKASSKLEPDVKEAWERHFGAVVEYEKCRARRERAVVVVEVWRSQNANRRVGQI